MKQSKQKKLQYRVTFLVLILLFAVCFLLCYTYYAPFTTWINGKLGIGKKDQTIQTTTPPIPAGETPTVATLKDLEIVFLNIGQGDCMLLCFPDGRNMLIDSGDTGNKQKNTIDQVLEERNISRLDYVLLTHQDADHVGNMDYVFENYEVDMFLKPNVKSTNPIADQLPDTFNSGLTSTEGGTVSKNNSYANTLVAAYQEEGCTTITFQKDTDITHSFIYEDNTYTYTLDFLTPTAQANEIGYKNANNYSPIMILEYGGTKVMFTGDAEEEVEEELLSYYSQSLDVDILKVGHHGSTTSSSSAFLDRITPEYAVIQCGVNNTYAHPNQDTLVKLDADHTTIYRNDLNGEITLWISAFDQFHFELENEDCTQNLVGGETLYPKESKAISYLWNNLTPWYIEENQQTKKEYLVA